MLVCISGILAGVDEDQRTGSLFSGDGKGIRFRVNLICGDYTFQLVDMFWLAKLGPAVPTALTIISVYLFFSLALNEIVGSGSVSVISQTIASRDVTAARRKILQVL